jgi:hypothetical protein
MERSLVQSLRVPDRGVRRARFAVLRDAAMPAVLIEGGYMTHPAESKRIYSATGRRQMSLAIVKGILAYQRLVSPPPPPRPTPKSLKAKTKQNAKNQFCIDPRVLPMF